ncbi:LysE family translocator [Candidatus Acetothermia bacterium]|nr:LysE family translocator [Candidatus Acetothermia bacterium]MBI3643436.1 LysE family translocator [Candidatus Acetothermia bacterium]
MFDLGNLAVFIVAVLVLAFTPGPDMLYIIARSAGQGRKAGVVSALGVGTGIVVHTTAAAIGLSAILASSAVAYDVVKYVGAVYLVYLGIRMFVSREKNLTPTSKLRGMSLWHIFTQAVVTNVLNPKVALFFLAFLPQFVTPENGNVALQYIFYGSLFNLIGTSFNTGIALLAGFLDDWLKRKQSYLRAQKWVTGSIFVALGLRLALLQKH